jgi:integrase/recombinase XerD
VSAVLAEYGIWLDRQRGLAPITVDNYCWNVEQFLTALPGPAQVAVGLVDAGRVTAFMVEYCRDCNTNSAKTMARSLRSFLRFAHATGRTSAELWGAVPASSALASGVVAEGGASGRC